MVSSLHMMVGKVYYHLSKKATIKQNKTKFQSFQIVEPYQKVILHYHSDCHSLVMATQEFF